MRAVPVLESVSTADPRTITIKGRVMATGFFKAPRHGAQRVEREGLTRDTVVVARRGGIYDQALSAYSLEHYDYWRSQGVDVAERHGAFAENLTVTGVLETDAHIGELWRIGSALAQVCQPRLPCSKLDMRYGRGFSKRFLKTRRVGYYLRVLEEGEIEAGQPIRIEQRDPESPTIDEFLRLAMVDYWDSDGLRWLVDTPAVPEGWMGMIEDKLDRSEAAAGWFGTRPMVVANKRQGPEHSLALELRCPYGRYLPPVDEGDLLTVSLSQSSSAGQIRLALPMGASDEEPESYTIYLDASHAELGEELAVGSSFRALAPRAAKSKVIIPSVSHEPELLTEEDL